jgi:hypothetical protein
MAVHQPRSDVSIKPTAHEPTRAYRGVTVRAVLIGFVAIIPCVFWGVYGDVVSQTDLTSTSLMMPPILALAALLILNGLLRRTKPSWVLTQSELLTVYVMLTVSVVLSGMGMIQFLCTTLGAVPHFATPENTWNDYLSYIPHTILPKLSAIEGFYKGGEAIPWSAWARPIAMWSGFLFAMLFCMLCINSILRKQWMDRERLTFPIVQLPLEMTAPGTSFFSNKGMWAGFFLAAGLETLNSISALVPNVPHVQLRSYDLAPNFTTPPWNAMGYFPSTFYPLAIGLGYVLSTDLSFSCWFFYILTKLENVFVAWIGWKGGASGTLSSPPYLGQQGTGGFVGIVVISLYLARNHIRDVLRKALTQTHDVDDSNEPMSYTMAVGCLAVGLLVMVAFCYYVGMSPLVAIAYLGLYLLFSTTISRFRAEAGPAWTMGPDMNALETVIQPIGSSAFSKRNLIALAYFNWFSIEMRCCPMPTSIEGMKIAQTARIRQPVIMLLMIAAIVVGIAVGFWACLKVWYQFGAASAKVEPWRTFMGRAPFERVTYYMNNPTRPDLAGTIAILFGAGFAFVLSLLRTKFVWFPFHPVGYVLANTGTLYWLWCPFFVAWLCKVVITKYCGIKGYRATLPFFLGLVLGDYISASLWALAGSILGIQMYRCFPC